MMKLILNRALHIPHHHFTPPCCREKLSRRPGCLPPPCTRGWRSSACPSSAPQSSSSRFVLRLETIQESSSSSTSLTWPRGRTSWRREAGTMDPSPCTHLHLHLPPAHAHAPCAGTLACPSPCACSWTPQPPPPWSPGSWPGEQQEDWCPWLLPSHCHQFPSTSGAPSSRGRY